MRFLPLVLALVASQAFADASPDINISPCAVAYARGLPCVSGQTQTSNYVGPVTLPSTSPLASSGPTVPTAPLQSLIRPGATVAQVEANFPAIMLALWTELTPAELNAQFALLDPVALARFSQAFYMEGGNITSLTAIATAKLSAPNLARFQTSFNTATTAPLAQSHAAHIKAGAVMRTGNGLTSGVGGTAAPSAEWSLYEIYEEYLFTQATTELEALILTAKFATVELGTTYVFAYKIGGYFYSFASYVDPDYGYDLTTLYGQYDLNGLTAPDSGVSITVGDPYDTVFPPGAGAGWCFQEADGCKL
jgi:hypothetical protein